MSRPEKYLAFFHRAYTDTPEDGVQPIPSFILSWNWPAFLFTLPWLFYRKQYLYGFAFFGINAGIAFLAPTAQLFPFFVWLALKFLVAINARSLYVDKAVAKIRAARAERVPVREWEAHLQLIGGVSHFGTFLAIALIVAEAIIQVMILRAQGYFDAYF